MALKKRKLRTCADRSVDNVLKVELDTRGGQRERGRGRQRTRAKAMKLKKGMDDILTRFN